MSVLLQKIRHGHDAQLRNVVQVKKTRKAPSLPCGILEQIKGFQWWQNQCPSRRCRQNDNVFQTHSYIVPTTHVGFKRQELFLLVDIVVCCWIGKGCLEFQITCTLRMVPIHQFVSNGYVALHLSSLGTNQGGGLV